MCGSVNTAWFLTVHSNDQCKVCCPATSLQVVRSPKPFLAILEYCKKSKSEAREGLGTRLCILLLRLYHLPLSQTPTVNPIPGNLLLLTEYLDTVLP